MVKFHLNQSHPSQLHPTLHKHILNNLIMQTHSTVNLNMSFKALNQPSLNLVLLFSRLLLPSLFMSNMNSQFNQPMLNQRTHKRK